MLTQKIRIYVFLLSAPLTAFCAEKGVVPLTLKDALSRTLRGSPELSAYSFDLRAAEARILQAGLRPNPEVSLLIENPTGSGSLKSGEQMQDTLQLNQLIELGGKRVARISEADAGRAVTAWEYQWKRVEVLKTTTVLFIDALAAQRRTDLAEEVVKDLSAAVKLTQERVDVGKVSTVEAIRAQVSMSSARIEVEQARRDIAAARGNLAAQWGARDADFGPLLGDLRRHEDVPSLQTLRQMLLGNPDLARWTAEREKRQATLVKEQTLARSDVTLMAGPRMLGTGADATFVVGFSIPLPVNNRNQGNIAEARANLAKLDEEKRAAEARAFASLNEAYQKLMGASDEITILQDSVIPGAQDAEKQLLDGYAAGRFTQLEVLDARRTLTAARVQQVRAHADFLKARAELDALTARPIELPRSFVTTPVPATPAHTKRK